MTLTFLGTGTSTGIPVLGCNCSVCRSNDPRDRRLRTSALITTTDGRHILIDCGPDVRAQLLANNTTSIDGVIITHNHYDHVGGLDDLRTLSYKNGIDVYTTTDVATYLRQTLPYCFSDNVYPNIPRLQLKTIAPLQPFDLAGLNILPLPVTHGMMPIVGFRIGPLAYITDASIVPYSTIEAVQGIDTLVINSLRITPNPTHMNLEQSLDIISRIAPRRAYLIHMSHQMGPHATATGKLPQGVEFAYDGLQISLPQF